MKRKKIEGEIRDKNGMTLKHSKVQARLSSSPVREEEAKLPSRLVSSKPNHIDFSELAAWGCQPEPPILVLGACNILTGRPHKFISYLKQLRSRPGT